MKLKLIFISFYLLVLASFTACASIGNTSNGTSTDTLYWNGSWINSSRCLSSTNMTLTTIYARLKAGSGRYKCAIYNGSSTIPTTFLRGTLEVTGTSDGWNSFLLTSPVDITSGNYYWLAIWTDSNAEIYANTSGGLLKWVQIAYGNWPTTWTSSDGNSYNYCIYASGSPSISAPTITTQPVSRTNLFGSPITLSVAATGGNLSYQWYFSGVTNPSYVAIQSATNNTFTQTASYRVIGRYYVIVSNAVGTVASSVVYLGVTNAPPNPNITINLTWLPIVNPVKYEVWSSTNIMVPFTLYTNVGLATNVTFTYPKVSADAQRFYYVKGYFWQGTITNLSNATLAWDYICGTTNDVTNYNIYYGVSSQTYTNKVPVAYCTNKTGVVSNLLRGVTYYFAATAVDRFGLESDYSSEVSILTPPNIVITNAVRVPVALIAIR